MQNEFSYTVSKEVCVCKTAITLAEKITSNQNDAFKSSDWGMFWEKVIFKPYYIR